MWYGDDKIKVLIVLGEKAIIEEIENTFVAKQSLITKYIEAFYHVSNVPDGTECAEAEADDKGPTMHLSLYDPKYGHLLMHTLDDINVIDRNKRSSKISPQIAPLYRANRGEYQMKEK